MRNEYKFNLFAEGDYDMEYDSFYTTNLNEGKQRLRKYDDSRINVWKNHKPFKTYHLKNGRLYEDKEETNWMVREMLGVVFGVGKW